MLSAIDSSKMSLWGLFSSLWSKPDGCDTAGYSSDSQIVFNLERNGGDSHINDKDSDDGSAVFEYKNEQDEDDHDGVSEWLALESSDEWQKEKPKYTLVRYFTKYVLVLP
jgi:hypothetical protein